MARYITDPDRTIIKAVLRRAILSKSGTLRAGVTEAKSYAWIDAMLAGAAFTGNVSVSGTLRNIINYRSIRIYLCIRQRNGAGTFARLERNNNANTPTPASLVLRQGNNTWFTLWRTTAAICASAGLRRVSRRRISIRAQLSAHKTSSLDTKDVIGEPDTDSLWGRIASGTGRCGGSPTNPAHSMARSFRAWWWIMRRTTAWIAMKRTPLARASTRSTPYW